MDPEASESQNAKSRKYIEMRDLLVSLEFAPSLAVADRLIEERRVRLCGIVVTSGSMTVASDETDLVLGPKQTSPSSLPAAPVPSSPVLPQPLAFETLSKDKGDAKEAETTPKART